MRKVFSINPVSHKGYSIIAFFCALSIFFSPLVVLAEEVVLPEAVEPQVTIVQEEVPTVEVPVEEEVVATPEITEDEVVIPTTEVEAIEEEQVATTTETTIESATSTETSELLDLILNATTTATSSLNLFEDESSENTQGTTTVSESTPELMESEEDTATSTEPIIEEVKETALVSEVLTPNGYKNINELTIGDEVVGYDFGTGEKVTNVIEKVELITPVHFNYWEQDEEGSYTNYIEVPFTSYKVNGHYSLFKDQSVFANGRVVHASQLSVGDIFYTIDGEEVAIETVEEEVSSDQWVKLSVSGNHTYVAGDMILHNASRYWVGGASTQNWNVTSVGVTNWGSMSNTRDSASIPGASDDVIFDGVGFGASDSTISAAITINSLDMTGYANTLTHNAVLLTIAGNKLKLSPNMTYVRVNPATSAITFTSTSGTSGSPTEITTSGNMLGNITLNGLGGYFTLQDDVVSEGALTLTAGTFDAGNRNVSVGTFSSSNANVRTLAAGSGTWNVTGSGVTVWTTSTVTNLTFTTRPTINFTYSGSVGTRTMSTGLMGEGVVPNINVTAGSDIFGTGSSSYIGSLNFTGFSGTLPINPRTVYGDLILSPTMTVVSGTANTTFSGTSGTSTITSNSQVIDFPLTLNGTNKILQLTDDLTLGDTRALTLTAGTFDANDKNVSVGILISTNTNVRTLSTGAGIWNITGSGTTVLSMSTVTNLTLTSRPTFNFTYSGSTGTRTISPGVIPENLAPNINVMSGSDVVAMGTNNWIYNLNFTGFSGSLSNSTRTIYGDLILSPTMTTVGGTLTTTMGATAGTRTITSNGLVLEFPLIINGSGGTFQLNDDLMLDSARTLTLANGTLNANGNDVSVGIFSSSGTGVRTLTVGSGTWNLTGSGGAVWNTGTITNFTLTAKPTLNLTYSGSVGVRTISTGTGFSESIIPNFNITAGTDSITMPSITVGSIDFTGFSGTLNLNTRTILGSLTLSPTMTVAPGSAITTMGGTLATSTITTNGVLVDIALTVNGVGGVVQLGDDLTMGDARILTLTNGTFDANGHDVSVGLFSSSNSNIRTLTVGSGTWDITGSDAAVWRNTTGTNFILTTKPTINLTYAGSDGTRVVGSSSLVPESVAPNFNITAGDDRVFIGDGSSLGSLNFMGFSGELINSDRTIFGDLILSPNMTVAAGASVTIMGATAGTKIISSAGKTLDFPLTIGGAGGTFQLADNLTVGSTQRLTLTAGTFDANDHDVSAGAFFSSNTNPRVLNMGSGTWTMVGTSVVWNTEIQTGLTLNPESSTVILLGTGQKIYGSNNFNNLTKIASSTDILFFEEGATQRIIGTLLLKGEDGSPLSLQGVGTYREAVDYTTPTTPRVVVSADVNSDAKKDLIVSSIGTLSVYMGNGDGTFATRVDYIAGGTSVRSIAVVDFNGDGKPDVAMPADDTDTILVFTNNGDGTFASPVTYACAGDCVGASAGDFNGDGKQDVVTANYTEGTVSVLINNGDGAFASAVTYATLALPRKTAVADFDQDGKVDLVVSSKFTTGLSVLFNNGDGTFGSSVDIVTSGVNPGIAATDLNADGYPDILAGTNTSLAISMNNGDGTFASEVKYGSLNREDVQVGDWDKDGDMDAFLVTNTSAANGGPAVYLFLNDGNGVFTPQIGVSTPADGIPLMVAVEDFDGDTELDLAVVNQALDTVSIFISKLGEQWNINPEGERDLAYLNVKNSNNSNPVFIAAYNAPGIIDQGGNSGWYFTPPTIAAPVSSGRTSTVTGGSGAPVVQSLPDSFITSTPEGLQIAPYETKIIETVTQNPVQPQYVFTENSYAEVTEDVDITYPEPTQVFEEVQVDTVENVKNISTETVVETKEVADSENIFVELGVGVLGLILIVLALFSRRIFNFK